MEGEEGFDVPRSLTGSPQMCASLRNMRSWLKARGMAVRLRIVAHVMALAVVWAPISVCAAEIGQFAGEYSGSVEIEAADGQQVPRDISVTIRETSKGFVLKWVATTEKGDGRRKTKSYEIEFQPSNRSGVFSAAMRRNVFGHAVPLDPMEGEPFVWGRIDGDTLTVFSMFIHPNGDYEIQQYDRTLAEGGLDLVYVSRLNGEIRRKIEAFLTRL